MTTEPVGTSTGLQTEQMAAMLFAATQDVFTSMLGVEIQKSTEPVAERVDRFDGVIALIGLTGPVVGNGALMCSAEAACAMSSLLLSTEVSNVDEQVLDALGEMTNMIVGGFKSLLETHTGRLQMGIPSVIYGKNIATRDSKANVKVTVGCAFPRARFELKIHLAAARG